MTNTQILIDRLSSDNTSPKTLGSPRFWVVLLLAVLAAYGIATQIFLGLRPDLAFQLGRPLFVAEIGLLATLLFTSVGASVLAMYPDTYQQPKLLRLPYIVFILLSGLLVFQLFTPLDLRMVMPLPGAHAVECAICIGAVALVPSAVIFALLRKGASVRQFQAGSFAALAATAIGCLTLRLSEANDSMMHLVSWHYLPTLLFTLFGALIGKYLLRW